MNVSQVADFLLRLRENLKQRIGYIVEMAAVLVFLGFFAAILLQIYTRYVVHNPLQWTEELARLFYVGMIFLAAAVAVDEHFRLRLGMDFIKAHSLAGYRILTIFIDIITLIVLYYFAAGSYNRIVAGWTRILPATGFKQSFFYIPLLIGSSLLIVFTLLNLLSGILTLRKGADNQ